MLFETYTQRQANLAKAGQADVYSYDDFPEAFRTQIIFIWRRVFGDWGFDQRPYGHGTVARSGNGHWEYIAKTLAEALGVYSLIPGVALNPQQQCCQFLATSTADGVLDILELTLRNINVFTPGLSLEKKENEYSRAITEINARLQQHSIGFEFIDGQLIRKDSQYLHQEAVKPAIGLLNRPGFTGPSAEFLRAHEHLRAGEYQDAIIDANNAFESTMKAICDQRKWHYDAAKATAKDLIQIVIDQALIPASLTQQFTSLRTLLESGVPTVRNKNAAHGGGSIPVVVPEYIAAYAMHLAASNIVMLVEAHKAKP